MTMKKHVFIAVFFLSFFSLSTAYAKPEIDFFIDKNYDFSKIKSLYILPVDFDSIPENVELSLPNRVDDWVEEAFLSKKNKYHFAVKSTKRAWQDMQLISGPFPYGDPKESPEAFKFFRSKLGDVCSAVLHMEVSLARNKRWIEPRTETYTEYERVKVLERRRGRGNTVEYVETYVTKPVVKVRTIPGEWIVTAEGWCRIKLYDAKNLNGKYIAAAKAASSDQSSLFHDVKPTHLLQGTVNAAIGSIFYK